VVTVASINPSSPSAMVVCLWSLPSGAWYCAFHSSSVGSGGEDKALACSRWASPMNAKAPAPASPSPTALAVPKVRLLADDADLQAAEAAARSVRPPNIFLWQKRHASTMNRTKTGQIPGLVKFIKLFLS
jgi:hypothetical protein